MTEGYSDEIGGTVSFAEKDILRVGSLDPKRHVRLRSEKVPRDYVRENKPGLEGYEHYDWAREVVMVRGEWLVKEHSEIVDDFRDGASFSRLAMRYVPWDYKLSPRTARRIVYHALERLVNPEELEGIEADPLVCYNESKERKPRKKKEKVCA